MKKNGVRETKRKKLNRKRIVIRLDEAVSKFVRERDKQCVLCGTDYRLGNGHIFTRKNYSTRWDISEDGNCHTQCWSCNFYHSSVESWRYFDWYIGKFGQEKFDDLYRRHKSIVKFTTPQLYELLEKINGKRENDK